MAKKDENIVKPRIFLSWGIFDAYCKLQGTVPFDKQDLARQFVAKKNAEIKAKNPLSKEQFYVARMKTPVHAGVQFPAVPG